MTKEEIFKDDISRIYKTNKEAKLNKKRGDKIFYDPSLDKYYVVTPKRRKFWGK